MTLIDRARHLLTCDELRGRLPDEVTAFLREVVALEPTKWWCSHHDSYMSHRMYQTYKEERGEKDLVVMRYDVPLYTLETSHDAG